MEVFQFNFLRLMTVFKNNFYLNCAKTCRSIATDRVSTKEHFLSALFLIMVSFEIDNLRSLVLKQNVLPNGVYFNLSDYYASTDIYDIFKLILSIQFFHYCLKTFIHKREWQSYKWLGNFIIVGSNIGVFTIVLILSCIGLIIVPSPTFEKIIFVIFLVVNNYISYFAYYTARTTDWFDKYIYSVCYTYTSTVNHNELKDRQYLIVSNLATRWHTKNVKKITQKKTIIVQSAPQDPRLNRRVLVNKGLNNIHSQFTSLNTSSQSLGDKDEYLISTRIVRPDSYYDQSDTSGTCSNTLATRWHTKNVKKITQKETKIVQSAPQDPRLNRHVLVNKGLNNIHSQFKSLNTSSQSLEDKGEYLISTRIVRPDSYYDQSDTSAWGKSELNKYPNKYKLIPM